ncbi:ABC transporter ATP-binding protein [soil metagenome]
MALAPALEARSLYRFYRAGEDETLALREVSLTVAAGELIAVVGPSGSGKSTLLACLAGLDEPDGGTVLIDGHRLSHRPETVRARMRAAGIGVLFQSGNLLEHLTVTGNVALSQAMAGGRPTSTPADLLAAVGVSERAGSYPSRLFVGESARAAWAVALANDPVVILADEPTGELDSQTEEVVLDLLRARARRGVAVVVVSHSPGVTRVADRVIRLVDGQVAA